MTTRRPAFSPSTARQRTALDFPVPPFLAITLRTSIWPPGHFAEWPYRSRAIRSMRTEASMSYDIMAPELGLAAGRHQGAGPQARWARWQGLRRGRGWDRAGGG